VVQKARAGHATAFGLDLDPDDKAGLIASLRTL
jgi:hypothetical protein